MDSIFPQVANLTQNELHGVQSYSDAFEDFEIAIVDGSYSKKKKKKKIYIGTDGRTSSDILNISSDLNSNLRSAYAKYYFSNFSKIIKVLENKKKTFLAHEVSFVEDEPQLSDVFARILNSIEGLICDGRAIELKENISVKTMLEAYLSSAMDRELNIIPVNLAENEIYGVTYKKTVEGGLISALIRLLDSLPNMSELFEIEHDASELEKSLSIMDHPVALISSQGELIMYNAKFSKLKIFPQRCLDFKDGDLFESPDGNFIVERKDVGKDGKASLFSFLGSRSNSESESTQFSELGIISSSIAHELNNPLAGILAGISFLEIQDDVDDETLSGLKEMKESAKRARDLVKIFLGFSRYISNEKEPVSVHECLSTALNLLRVRMIESNLRLELNGLSEIESSGKKLMINSSVLTIVLYQILSEGLTSYSHDRLVKDKKNVHVFDAFVSFSGNVLELNFPDFDGIEKTLKINKLVKHLLGLEGIKLSLQGKKIYLVFGDVQ